VAVLAQEMQMERKLLVVQAVVVLAVVGVMLVVVAIKLLLERPILVQAVAVLDMLNLKQVVMVAQV
jgi:hypothetical protein